MIGLYYQSHYICSAKTIRMKFGKLPDVSNVNFLLPQDAPINRKILEKKPSQHAQAHFYIGATGWSMKEWIGTFYPIGTKSKDYLRQYTRQFNTIEMNTTHYRIPTVEMVEKWRSEAEADFKFCPKIPQTISHSNNLGLKTGQTEAFCEAIRAFGDRLGCCFIQLPPHFGVDKLDTLRIFLQNFPSDVSLAVEARHESWFSNPKNTQQLLELLEQNKATAVITDVAGRRDVLHMGLTNTVAMIRFVGNGLHPSDYSRIKSWIERLNQWRELGMESIYFFVHEPDNIQAPELASYLYQQLLSNPQFITRGPQVQTNESKQISLF